MMTQHPARALDQLYPLAIDDSGPKYDRGHGSVLCGPDKAPFGLKAGTKMDNIWVRIQASGGRGGRRRFALYVRKAHENKLSYTSALRRFHQIPHIANVRPR